MMLLAVRSTSCAAASENATRELVGSAMGNPSELGHGRDMASPRSCCYWPHGQGEGSQRAKPTDSPWVADASTTAPRDGARCDETPGIHCCRDDDDLAKAVRHMEQLQVRRLPVINRSRRMVGILSLGDISNSAPGDLLSECVKSVSAHH